MSEQSTEKEIHIHNEFFFTHNKEMQFKVKKQLDCIASNVRGSVHLHNLSRFCLVIHINNLKKSFLT